MKKKAVTLIGMPGAGKSTVGVVLSKRLGLGFVDTDILIQTQQGKTLQSILDQYDYLTLRKIEESTILTLDTENSVISTGGSAVYSAAAMEKLKTESTVVYLEVQPQILRQRITDLDTRGIARADNQSFLDLWEERTPMYRHYADIQLDNSFLNQDEIVGSLASQLERLWGTSELVQTGPGNGIGYSGYRSPNLGK